MDELGLDGAHAFENLFKINNDPDIFKLLTKQTSTFEIIYKTNLSQEQTGGNQGGREEAQGDELWSGECEGRKTHHLRAETSV